MTIQGAICIVLIWKYESPVQFKFQNSIWKYAVPILTAEWQNRQTERKNFINLFWKYLVDIRSEAWLYLFWKYINGIYLQRGTEKNL
jgi:hypothetical protein